MLRGIYTSAMGLAIQDKRLDVISNNLANINTNGYKNDTTVIKSFDDMLTQRINDTYIQQNPTGKLGNMPLSTGISEVFTDYNQGKMVTTSNKTDLAISESNNSFFVISVPNNNSGTDERYTRDGAFTLNAEGELVTSGGYAVKGEKGPIILENQDFVVNNKGEIIQAGKVVDKLQIKTFEDTKNFRKLGNNLIAIEGQAKEAEFKGQVRQGLLEGSNVNSIREMVSMINVMRSYEANQKILSTHDQTLGKAVNEVGSLK